jgi:hypothetical protein
MAAFAIQLWFELQKSVLREDISAEIVVDRGTPEIRQWRYTGATRRASAEGDASDWCIAEDPQAFDRDREKLTTDFVLFSLVLFLASNESGWEIRRRRYVGKSSGTITSLERLSKGTEHTAVTADHLRQELSKAQNVFANAALSIDLGALRLPPNSTLAMTPRSLAIRNPICQVSFTLDVASAASFMKPGSGDVPTLVTGHAQFETRWINLRAESIFFALRAQHQHAAKYRAWATGVVEGARRWFED